ncbi:cation:proton antiporter [Candidatus Woesearchaeota archaeon]|nr:cation:proton antiporter [Candidatus Woesearchaeota archaeon]
MVEYILRDIGIIIVFAALAGIIIKYFKQPMILAYIFAGLAIGPFGLNFISSEETIISLSELGITFLLFVVGLELNINKLKEVGRVVLLAGSLQILLTFLFSIGIVKVIGFTWIQSIYLAVVLAFSSTLLVVSLLAEKKEIDTLHGRIIVGILVLQDIMVIVALSLLSNLSNFSILYIPSYLGKGILLLATAYFMSRFLLNRLFDFTAKYQELLFVASLALCFVLTMVASYLGFSVSIGAFLAGVMIANLPYSLDLTSRIKSLAIFFNALFFVSLGIQIVPSTIKTVFIPLLVLLGITFILKPLLIIFLVIWQGYDKKTAVYSGIGLGQISEFGLIVVAQGILLGHVDSSMLSLTILLIIVSMALSSYAIKYNLFIYHRYFENMKFLDRFFRPGHVLEAGKSDAEVVVYGYENLDPALISRFKEAKKDVLVIDNNPNVIKSLKTQSMNCLYGDISQVDVLEKVNFEKVQIVISTIPDIFNSMVLIKKTREANRKAVVILTANKVKDSLDLYNEGADYVILPNYLGEKQVSLIVESVNKDLNSIVNSKLNHIEELRKKEYMQRKLYEQDTMMVEIDTFLKNITHKIGESSKVAHKVQKTAVDTMITAQDIINEVSQDLKKVVEVKDPQKLHIEEHHELFLEKEVEVQKKQ